MYPVCPNRFARGQEISGRARFLGVFIKSQSGAVAVDFVPLTFAVIGLCVAAFSFLSVSLEAPSMQVVDALDKVMDEAKFNPEPSKTKPSKAAVPQVDQPPQGSAPSSGSSSSGGAQPANPTPSNAGTTPAPTPSSGGGGGGSTVAGVGYVSGSDGGSGNGDGTSGTGSAAGEGAVFGAGDGISPDAEDGEADGDSAENANSTNPVSEQPATLSAGDRS